MNKLSISSFDLRPVLLRVLCVGLITCLSLLAYGQDSKHYVILRPTSESIQSDTIFGEIEMPKKGVFWNIKINTNEGRKKFKNREVVGIQVEDLFFASIPYGTSYAIVPRIVTGKMDLYYYYTGSDRYKHINKSEIKKDKISGYPTYDLSAIVWNLTSYFYLNNHESNEFYKIPRSNTKFREETSKLFLDDPDLRKRIINGELEAKDIVKIVKLYNGSGL